MDNLGKFGYPSLPSKGTRCSSLRLRGISDANYQHALNVYNKFECSKFLDYYMLKLNCDVLLLADVFDEFRQPSILHYKLDPTKYITSSSYAWNDMPQTQV